MAKKSLKKRIDDLIDALGRAKKPTLAEIRSELVSLGTIAESLEDGQALAEKDARITALETELRDLKIALDVATGEIEAFRAEREKQEEEEKKKEIPPAQYKILKWLPSRSGGNRQDVREIARAIKLPVDETEIHIDRLAKAHLIEHSFNQYDATVWCRSMSGNELVLAKRLAGEEEAEEPKAQTEPRHDLVQLEQLVLLAVAQDDVDGVTAEEITEYLATALPTIGQPIASVPMVQLLLIKLREKKMATDGDRSTYGTPPRWHILRAGMEYLAERDRL